MRHLLLFTLICITLSFTSCSVFYNAYLRNFTNEAVIIDVFLLEKEHMQKLPNIVTISNKIIEFKSGYKNQMNSYQNVEWITLDHFRFELKPNTTADLTDMAGSFLNSNPVDDIRVLISTSKGIDTLIAGRSGGRKSVNFEYEGKFFGSPILYYDIK